VAKRESAANAAAGGDVDGGGGDGAAPRTAPHYEIATFGLPAVEEAVVGGSAVASISGTSIPGTVALAGQRIDGVCGGVGMRARPEAHREEGRHAGLGELAAGLARNGSRIQITPQMRILVAVEAVEGRKGIDSLIH